MDWMMFLKGLGIVFVAVVYLAAAGNVYHVVIAKHEDMGGIGRVLVALLVLIWPVLMIMGKVASKLKGDSK